MRLFTLMSQEDKNKYLKAMGGVVGSLVPPDSRFVFLIGGADGTFSFVDNGPEWDMPKALREVADHMEFARAQGKEQRF